MYPDSSRCCRGHSIIANHPVAAPVSPDLRIPDADGLAELSFLPLRPPFLPPPLSPLPRLLLPLTRAGLCSLSHILPPPPPRPFRRRPGEVRSYSPVEAATAVFVAPSCPASPCNVAPTLRSRTLLVVAPPLLCSESRSGCSPLVHHQPLDRCCVPAPLCLLVPPTTPPLLPLLPPCVALINFRSSIIDARSAASHAAWGMYDISTSRSSHARMQITGSSRDFCPPYLTRACHKLRG